MYNGNMGLKLVSINIEGRKHLKEVKNFLAREKADAVCLMEVCQSDVLVLAGEEYPFVVFAQNDVLGNITGSTGLDPTGVAILSKVVMIDVEKTNLGERPRNRVVLPKSGTHAPVLLIAKIGDYQIGAVHFTWTKKGEVSSEQTMHIGKLLTYLEAKGELVLCGDFNIPRGNDNYKMIAKVLKDNIPSVVESTIDPVLHYGNQEVAGKLKLVVDYIFSTPKYKVGEVEVVQGVSDHCALVCTISLV